MSTLYHCKICNTREHWADEECKVANAVANGYAVVANAALIATQNKHGRYADKARRADYMKDLMQARRAIKSGRASRWP